MSDLKVKIALGLVRYPQVYRYHKSPRHRPRPLIPQRYSLLLPQFRLLLKLVSSQVARSTKKQSKVNTMLSSLRNGRSLLHSCMPGTRCWVQTGPNVTPPFLRVIITASGFDHESDGEIGDIKNRLSLRTIVHF